MKNIWKVTILCVMAVIALTLLLRWVLAPHDRCMLSKGVHISTNGAHRVVVDKNSIKLFYESQLDVPYATIPHQYRHRGKERCIGTSLEGITYELVCDERNKVIQISKQAENRPHSDPIILNLK